MTSQCHVWLRQDKYLLSWGAVTFLMQNLSLLTVGLGSQLLQETAGIPSVPGAVAGLLWQLPVFAWSHSVALVQLTWLSSWKRIKDDAVFHHSVALASQTAASGSVTHIPQPLSVWILKGDNFHTSAWWMVYTSCWEYTQLEWAYLWFEGIS